MEMQEELIDILIEFQLDKLEYLNIGIDMIIKDNCKIGELGVGKLVSKDWPALKLLSLSS